jgi:polysaccharide deacetylase family protein (PEP-CTERM system associated)
VKSDIKNIMTIDLEEWYHANYHDGFFDETDKYEVRIVKNTEKILDLFDKYDIKATFFVLGMEAEKFPELIKKISDKGHDMAVHGYTHDVLYDMSPDDFRKNILKAKGIVENITGKKVIGFRAPSWSINESNMILLNELKEMGFLYDSSVFPVKNMLYGMPNAKRFIHKPVVKNNELDIYEIPMTTLRVFGVNIPFSGGFYFRVVPLSIIKAFIKIMNSKKHPVISYLHPREIDTNHPEMDMKFHERLIHYTGIKRCFIKFEKLLKAFRFTSIADYYKKELDELQSG